MTYKANAPIQRIVFDVTALMHEPAGAVFSLDLAHALVSNPIPTALPVTLAFLSSDGFMLTTQEAVQAARAGFPRETQNATAIRHDSPGEMRLSISSLRTMRLAEIVRWKSIAAERAAGVLPASSTVRAQTLQLTAHDALVVIFNRTPADTSRLDALMLQVEQAGTYFVALAPDPRPLDTPHLFAPIEIEVLTELWGELPWIADLIFCMGEAAANAGRIHAIRRRAPARIEGIPETVANLTCPPLSETLQRTALCVGPIGDAGRQATLVEAVLAAFADGRLQRGRDHLVIAGSDAYGGAAVRERITRNPAANGTIKIVQAPSRSEILRLIESCRALVDVGVPGWGGAGLAAAATAGRPLVTGLDPLDLYSWGDAIAAAIATTAPPTPSIDSREIAHAFIDALHNSSHE